MKQASDLIPWRVTDISLRPFKDMWSFNPSLHFDGSVWRCVLRCADYAMPDGVTIRSCRAQPGQSRTRNAMVILDPGSWKPVEIYKMRERDSAPRVASANVGYEDIRIFATAKGGLQGIAAALHVRRAVAGGPQLPEQVLLSFDNNYEIVDARPLRGAWSDTAQKNWVPFDRSAEPRFLYSISRGSMLDARGVGLDTAEPVQSSSRRLRLPDPDERASERARKRAKDAERRRRRERRREREREPLRLDADPPVTRLDGLRGGTQLLRVSDDAWLGIGHEMKLVGEKKYYWHTWYVVDSRGRMKAASPPMKLAPNGIEFAAGMAIDGDRVVVSFGVDDMECRLGETRLAAVMALLEPAGR